MGLQEEAGGPEKVNVAGQLNDYQIASFQCQDHFAANTHNIPD